MTHVPKSIKRMIADPKPDVDAFIREITGKDAPAKVRLCELNADEGVMEWFTEGIFEELWVPPENTYGEQAKKYWNCVINWWWRLGYDYIRVSGGLRFPGTDIMGYQGFSHLGKRSWAHSRQPLICSWEDFKRYPWPKIMDEELWHYYYVSSHLPEGMGILVRPIGLLELLTTQLLDFEKVGLLSFDNPDLLTAICEHCTAIILSFYEKLVDIPEVVGFFHADDFGHNTGTLFSPEFICTYIFPSIIKAAAIVHKRKKVFFLHSCGYLGTLIDELIREAHIDAKHSFQDIIQPVEAFYRQYGRSIGVLGGLDVNILAMADENGVRKRSREILDTCATGGKYAFGSGNSLTDYCKPGNILAMLDEALSWDRRG